MAKRLLIVESPAKARTIQQYLGKEYEVLASVGHVRDLPKSNKDAVDIEDGFVPRYVISPDKREVIEKIKTAAGKAEEVFLATDPDREGEAIAWHVKEAVGLKKPHRVVFHEITKAAVEEALRHPRAIDENLRQAQEARRVLDRLVGYDLSGLIWKKVRYGLSAGRVQSPALRILAEREREIKAFIPETYYTLDAQFKATGGEFPAKCTEEPTDPKEAARIVEEGRSASWTVAEVKERAEERNPRPPFTTSTLQQAASTRLGFSPSRTMRAAQKLYEAGHITYMRTDSVSLGKEAVEKLALVAEKEFGREYVEVRAYKTKSKNAQEAHEAVRPTDPSRKTAGATADENGLYELIRNRALSSQMSAAKMLRTSVKAKANAAIPLFSANGSRLIFPGWLACDTKARGEDVELPKLAEGESLTLLSLGSLEKQTEPPNRYTEAGLIKELEKRGIGRPSTYASTMKTIQDRGYVEKNGRTLMPTATGMVVSGWLEEHFTHYVSDSFTAEMEDELDEIARGERGYEATLTEFYTPFSKAVLSKEGLPKATSLGPVPEEFVCPLCQAEMEFKLGRGGIFMSCTRYPECDGARQEDGTELKSDEPIGNDPKTGAPIFVKTGRYGPYVEMELPESEVPVELTKTGKPKKSRGRPKKALKRASIPASTDLSAVSLADALHYLSLPRELGTHPGTGKPVMANIGRFGPYVGHDGEFRSLKAPDDPYTVTLDRAVEVLAEPKRPPKGVDIVREVGKHPKTGKQIVLYKSKAGLFLKKGLRRIYLPESQSADELTPLEAADYLK
ncbi:type I DNA topoisomerase [Patescibacteria group bacterium]|nr:type I DNA topoisomerase [Patescibacteria group bacterium]MBU1500817.1 type I DNA topoisomerase [Patescibacteria group bacterium]MBU2080872.1 type I DNA topoisomerase [Patescibacteria group bacterium]MBU2123977.1 type I DNA topoisomerase [Patescibacteria group bacterium]MBU2194732.1 type I DNA topoisomerase [Patescibacteria group bacterium]